MKQIITTAQAKEIDRYSIEQLGMQSIVLMERAALKFTEHMIEWIESRKKENIDLSKRKLLVVCGSGNNGGDGMAVARMLSQAGYDCAVFFAGEREKITESVKIQWKLLETLSIPIVQEFAPEPQTMIIDALFGIGLSREVTGHYAKLIEEMNHFRCFSIDVPSGMDADTGRGMAYCEGSQKTAVKAEFTVTFGAVKPGLLLGNGRQYAGNVFSEEIGFPIQARKQFLSGWHLELSDIPKLLPKRNEDSHKGNYGRVLIFAGSETMLGAAYYAGKAAYRMGAGLVEIVTCRQNIIGIAGMLPAAIYTPFEELFFWDEEEEKADKEALEQKIYAASSVVLGPGLGISGHSECIVGAVLAICSRIGKPLILDADGLNILSMHPEWQRLLTENIILTPHLKEMSRLCKKRVSEIKENMIGLAKEFSQKHHNAILLLKDSRSVITNGIQYFINVSGNHGMAVGGSGDVLSGILGGLMAQAEKEEEIGKIGEFSVFVLMASLGAFLHGLAGDYAKARSNAYSMMAEDILDGMKAILND